MAITDENVTASSPTSFAKEGGKESQPPKADEHESVGAATATATIVEAAVMTVDETATISPEKETTNDDETPAKDEGTQKSAEATKGTFVEDQ